MNDSERIDWLDRRKGGEGADMRTSRISLQSEDIKLGDRVRDKITGLEGAVLGKTEWLTGCVTFGVQPTDLTKDGKIADCVWFDQVRLELMGAEVEKKPEPNTGGPCPTPQAQVRGC